jgi:hypothetical protein
MKNKEIKEIKDIRDIRACPSVFPISPYTFIPLFQFA